MSLYGFHAAGIRANLEWSFSADAYALLLSNSSFTTFLRVDMRGPASCSAIVVCRVSICESTCFWIHISMASSVTVGSCCVSCMKTCFAIDAMCGLEGPRGAGGRLLDPTAAEA
jgi:hypothetical protein